MSQQSWSGLNDSLCALSTDYRVTNSKYTAPWQVHSRKGILHTPSFFDVSGGGCKAPRILFLPQEFRGWRQLSKTTRLGHEIAR